VITVLLLSPSLDVTYVVDAVTPGGIHRPRETLRLAGGKGLNLARAAVRLGGEAHVVAPLGGRIGEFVRASAAADGIALTSVPVAAETRSCVTIVPDVGDGLDVYEPASTVSDEEMDAVRHALRSAPVGGWTALAGSVPASIPTAVVVGALRDRAEAGDRLAVDTHGEMLRRVVREVRPDVVKVNRAEASELLDVRDGRPAVDLAAALRDRTGGTVVVTDGVDGSACVGADGTWIVAAHPAPGRFPVGSGDSFLAGLLVGLERGSSTNAALGLASAAASANARRPGGALFDVDALRAERDAVGVEVAVRS
jgi:1-phosphofructokinase family hexose kinase